MKRLLLVLMLITALAFSGCVEKQGQTSNTGDIKTSMIKAADNISSYSFTASQNQSESANEFSRNASYANATLRGASSEITASVDLKGHRVLANLATKTSITNPGGVPTVSSSSGTQYNIGNITYTRMNGENWTQLRDPTPESALWASGRYNTLKSRAESINQSQVEVIGTEKIDGADCYKLKLVMSNNTIAQALYNAVNSAIIPFVASPNATQIARNSNIEAFVWIDKESSLLRRYEYRLSVGAVPDIVGVFDISTGQVMMFNQSIKNSIKPVEVSVNTATLEHYYDFNQPMVIVPPKEALNATPIVPVAIEAQA